MTTSWKPEGYNSVSPYLVVSGAEGTIVFLEKVFGAKVLRDFKDPDNRVLHAEVQLDDSVIMLADGNEKWPPQSAHVHVYVANVDASFHLAIAAGARPVQEPAKGEDEDKRAGVRDNGGTTWWIATRVG